MNRKSTFCIFPFGRVPADPDDDSCGCDSGGRRLIAIALGLLCTLGAIGWFVHRTVEDNLQQRLSQELETILRADVSAMLFWLESQRRIARTAAGDPNVVRTVTDILELKEGLIDIDELTQSPQLQELRQTLAWFLDVHEYPWFLVIDPFGMVIAASGDSDIGTLIAPEHYANLHKVMANESVVSLPYYRRERVEPSTTLLPGSDDSISPTIYVAAPIADDTGTVLAAIGFRVRPEDDFTRILSIAQRAGTGHAYAFSERGVMLTQSPYDKQLKAAGVIPDGDDSHSMLHLEIRAPEGNMIAGFRSNVDRRAMPLTRMAASATAAGAEVRFPRVVSDVTGYPDYRGVPVIGAWAWLPEHRFGVAAEMDYADAYKPLLVLRCLFWALFGLVSLSCGGGFAYLVANQKIRQRMKKAEGEARQLGQYRLTDKIGEGGMGEVYKACHVMLRRPTAIKLLRPDKTGEDALARFEREVHLTCRLNHPNTIAIYDYGRTPNGVFYYAMEYLDGLNLAELVKRSAQQRPARVVHIMRQLCGSLNEAHGIGLIHRDIKPANVLLCRRGGLADVVKLLDFGLIKDMFNRSGPQISMTDIVVGTPHFLAPEAVQAPELVDARSDLYALGLVGYYLLTGQYVFVGTSAIDICMKHVKEPPVPPSSRIRSSIPKDLEDVIMCCLEKKPAQRPSSALDLMRRLDACACAHEWTQDRARDWWRDNDPTEERRE